MNRFVTIAAATGVIGIAAFATVIFTGLVSVSARPPHSELTRVVLHSTFKSSIARVAQDVPAPPDLTDPGLIALGAQHYAQVCSSCHGGPGLGQSPQALSMRPAPQSLPAVVNQFTDEELFAILRDGVRFSAMPAWPAESNFDEIWSVVAFLKQLPGMSADDYIAMTSGVAAADVPAMPWGTTGAGTGYDIETVPNPTAEYLPTAPSTGWRPIGLDGTPVTVCASCHGLDGTGAVTGGNAPNIAIHSPAFIAQRLRDYASGARPSGMMAVVASSLSEQQIDALADYYGTTASVDGTTTSTAEVDSPGAQIALVGLPEAAVPACGSCHSDTASAAQPQIPAIAGQNAPFLAHRMDSFATSPAVITEAWNPMHGFARRMTPEQRSEVASYLASLDTTDPLTPAPRQTVETTQMPQGIRACMSCHGSDLAGDVGSFAPDLTLQNADYLSHQLALFHNGLRDNQLMDMVAHRADFDALDDIANWLGSLDPVPTSALPHGPYDDLALQARGEEIALNGLPDVGIAACVSCHGDSRARMIPQLNGQTPSYLAGRLDSFADAPSERAISPMSAITAKLSREDRTALAAYFAAQDPLPKN